MSWNLSIKEVIEDKKAPVAAQLPDNNYRKKCRRDQRIGLIVIKELS